MDTTPILGLPFPEPTDPITDYPAVGEELATDLETLLKPRYAEVSRVTDLATGVSTAWSPLIWTAEVEDTDAMVDIAGAPTRLTCKTAGLYHVWANVAIASSATARMKYVRILQTIAAGGTAVISLVSQDVRGNADEFKPSISRIVRLAVNDYLELYGYHEADPLTFKGAPGIGGNLRMGMLKVGK